MSALTANRQCLSCGGPLKGRADKKFCNDSCRNAFNNHQKAMGNYSTYVRNINNALLKNRHILASILPASDETVKARKEKLQHLGFRFKYHTHTYTTMSGKTYNYCYDYGYLPLENDWYLVVKQKDNSLF